jgi:DNA repair exonuclease SbcCD nuclease subunit
MTAFKALFLADTHMSNKLPYSKPTKNGLTDRFEDQLKMWKKIKKIVKSRNISFVFILGDLFDKSLVDAVTLSHTVESVTSIPAQIYVLPGNHEASSGRGGRFLVEVFNHTNQNATVLGIGDPHLHTIDVDSKLFNFWFFSYKGVDETKKELSEVRDKMDKFKTNIALVHNNILGAEHFGWSCDIGLDSDTDFVDFDYVLAGHFHKSQEFGERGLYLGAPMHHDFSDVGRDAGVWEFTFSGDEIAREFIPLKLPKFYKKKLKAKFGEKDLKRLLKGKVEKGDYLRIELECTKADWVKNFKTLNNFKSSTETEVGIHINLIHKPIYYHEERLENGSEFGRFSIDDAVKKYVEADGVDTSDLDKDSLREYASNILEKVRG